MSSTHRIPVIAGNWKLNKLSAEAAATARELHTLTEGVTSVEVIVAPTFTALHETGKALENSHVDLSGQNCYTKENGAFTGEISPQMLRDCGCDWVIIGHSERRQIFGEDDALLNAKVAYARESGLKVMFCIGETLEERESGEMNAVLSRQVSKGLEGLSADALAGIVIAYEPVWAIGTGVVATPDQAEDAHAFVRGEVARVFDDETAAAMRIQYGGSVKPDNAAELIGRPNVDGFLVGGASLEAKSFAQIVRAAAEAGATA